jgi:hypothetical protein
VARYQSAWIRSIWSTFEQPCLQTSELAPHGLTSRNTNSTSLPRARIQLDRKCLSSAVEGREIGESDQRRVLHAVLRKSVRKQVGRTISIQAVQFWPLRDIHNHWPGPRRLAIGLSVFQPGGGDLIQNLCTSTVLTIGQALACVDFAEDGGAGLVTPVVEATTPAERERLFHCEHFWLWPLRGQSPLTVGAEGVPHILVCIEGAGQVEHLGANYAVGKDDVLLLPAGVGECTFHPHGAVTLLEIAVPE